MSEGNKFVIRRSFEELWNKGNLSLADELFAPNYAHHDPSTPDFGRGPESEKKRATLYRTAFPDLQFTIEDIIAEGQTVKQVTISGVSVARFTGGKMVEGWVNWDALGLMQQLGVVPELAKTKAAAAKP